MIEEELLFDHEGNVDVEAMRDERVTRNVPPNPPPRAAQPRWLDGKAIARLAVSDCINCGSWLNQAVMQYLIDCANRKNGACYPSNETIAQTIRCSVSTVKRATRFWRRNGYRLHGTNHSVPSHCYARPNQARWHQREQRLPHRLAGADRVCAGLSLQAPHQSARGSDPETGHGEGGVSRSDPQRGSDVIQPRLRCEPLNSEGNSEYKTPSLSGASSDPLDN